MKYLLTTWSARLLLLFICIGLGACAPLVAKTNPDYSEPFSRIDFVYIPSGEFKMGDIVNKRDRETPVHKVKLAAFAISTTEITFGQYDKFCAATNRKVPDDNEWGRGDHPVINVSWIEAKAYTEWLSKQSGLPISLPSEAQWEYAARAGKSTEYWLGSKLPPNRANCSHCGSQWDNKSTAPVKSFTPSPWGLYDSMGNVAEWVEDNFHDSYKNAPTDGSAWVDNSSPDKVYRGGSWRYSKEELASATRDWGNKNIGSKDIGFRIVINGISIPQKK